MPGFDVFCNGYDMFAGDRTDTLAYGINEKARETGNGNASGIEKLLDVSKKAIA